MSAPIADFNTRAHYSATISSTAVAVATVVTSAAHRGKASRAIIQAKGATLAWRSDVGGATVTPTNGFHLPDTQYFVVLGNESIKALQFIRASGTDVTLVIALEWIGD